MFKTFIKKQRELNNQYKKQATKQQQTNKQLIERTNKLLARSF